MTNNEKIKKSKNPVVKQIADDLDAVLAIEAVALSEGGKVLIKNLLNDISESISTLCIKNSTLTIQEFVSLSSDIKSKLDLIKVIRNSKKNKEYLTQYLLEALSEEE